VPDNTQHKLDKNRTPRVHITYDVARGDATVERELPFVVGILADLSGHREEPLPRVKEREFIDINGESFDGIMADAKPRLQLTVDNTLQEGGNPLGVVLNFNKLDDFRPDNVVRQVKELRELMDEREMLSDVLNKMENTPKYDDTLLGILRDKEKRERLSGEVDDAVKRSAPETQE